MARIPEVSHSRIENQPPKIARVSARTIRTALNLLDSFT
jgi:hypothetical protein